MKLHPNFIFSFDFHCISSQLWVSPKTCDRISCSHSFSIRPWLLFGKVYWRQPLIPSSYNLSIFSYQWVLIEVNLFQNFQVYNQLLKNILGPKLIVSLTQKWHSNANSINGILIWPLIIQMLTKVNRMKSETFQNLKLIWKQQNMPPSFTYHKCHKETTKIIKIIKMLKNPKNCNEDHYMDISR